MAAPGGHDPSRTAAHEYEGLLSWPRAESEYALSIGGLVLVCGEHVIEPFVAKLI